MVHNVESVRTRMRPNRDSEWVGSIRHVMLEKNQDIKRQSADVWALPHLEDLGALARRRGQEAILRYGAHLGLSSIGVRHCQNNEPGNHSED